MFTTVVFCIALSGPASWNDPVATGPDVTEIAQVAKVHEGKIVSVTDGKLVVADRDGKNPITYMITPTAKIMLDGKPVKLTELKSGDAIKVTTAEGVVTMVDATRAAASPQ